MSLSAHSTFLRTLKRRMGVQMATLSVLAGSFCILSIAILVHQNVERLLTQWGDKVKVNVYLKETATKNEEDKVSQFISKSGLFNKVQFLTKKDAARKFKERIGQYSPGLLSDLEFDNPLPASFELELANGLKSNMQYSKLVSFAGELKVLSGVDEISYGQGWVENYATVLKAFSIVSTVFISVLLLGSLFVIGNSIGNSVAQRRDEIELLELFGATRSMILWPFIYEGIVLGFTAAASAIILTYALYQTQSDLLMSELSFWQMKENIEFLSWGRMLLILFFGSGLGALGSYLWARKANTGWAAAEATQN